MRGSWDETAARAAEQARSLRPLALVLFAAGMAMIAAEVAVVGYDCVVPADGPRGVSTLCVIRSIGSRLVLAGPAIALVWALWEAQAYLKRLEDGAVWAPQTMRLFERIGECLTAAAAWSAVIAPTLSAWIDERATFDWHLDASIVTLAGLGTVLIAISRVLGDVLETAGRLKSDADEIV